MRHSPFCVVAVIVTVAICQATSMLMKESCPKEPIDIVLVVDTSDSVKAKSLIVLKENVAKVVENVDVGPGDSQVRVAAVGFGFKAKIYFDFNKFTDKASLVQGINDLERVEHHSGTRTDRALTAMLELFDEEDYGSRSYAQRVAIIFTDGRATNEQKLKERLANMSAGITRYTIGIGKQIDRDELEQIADNVPRNVFFADDFEALPKLVKSISSRVRCACDPPCKRAMCNLRTKECKCPEGYGGEDCNSLCTIYGDEIFILDYSKSMRDSEFKFVREFANTMIDSLSIGEAKTHVGVITFADSIEVQLNLTTTFDKDTIKETVNNIKRPLLFRATNTAHALAEALNMFQTTGRNPDQFDRKVILITDGRSTDTRHLWDNVDKLVEARVMRYVVGVGDQILGGKDYVRAQKEIRGIAGQEKNVLLKPSFEELHMFANEYIAEVKRCG